MNLFEPWPSIETLNPCLYTVTEKLDGSNLCLSVSKNDFQIFTRQGKSALEAIPVLKKHLTLFAPIVEAFQQEIVCQKNSNILPDFNPEVAGINIYGEFLNFLNMKRIKYCSPKEALFKIFGISVIYRTSEEKNVYKLLFPEVEAFLEKLNLKEQYLVPVLERHVPISQIFSRQYISQKSAFCDAQAEGWVFHPEAVGGRIFKLKTPDFIERLASVKKTVSTLKTRDFEALYESFFTENRAFSIKSKLGVLTASNLGAAVTTFLEDVRKDIKDEAPELMGFLYTEKAFKINKKAYELMRRFKED